MNPTKWLPWNFILKWAARRYDILDPVTLLARIRQFGQPSEVMEPIELLRAGILFHARGVINTRAIQYNLDWIWPFWVEKQFSPTDPSFIPRGFSFSHINITHRNWTMVGQPDLGIYPLVDPRGLVTPIFDAWSIDAWLLTESGKLIAPSQVKDAEQTMELEKDLQVITSVRDNGAKIRSTTRVTYDQHRKPYLDINLEGHLKNENGWLIAAVRPYNPEGISFIDHFNFHEAENRLEINRKTDLFFSTSPAKVLFNAYEDGDIAHDLHRSPEANQVHCPIGMATGAVLFPVKKKEATNILCRIQLAPEKKTTIPAVSTDPHPLQQMRSQAARLEIPDKKLSFLYDAAVSTLLLLTADEVYPGPYTYRRFWFRDACFMINALLGLGLAERSRHHIRQFPGRQTLSGYFRSQEGEWDSNGQVLWLADRYFQLTGETPDPGLISSLEKGARWIRNKIRHKNDGKRHDGLLPAGFSAEHLGPNDYYYWDDFWSLAGLRAAVSMAIRQEKAAHQDDLKNTADKLENRIFETIRESPGYQKHGTLPASCYRRMDAGAVGSLVADYPLQITGSSDTTIMDTVNYLIENCFFDHAFFQDMIHSGMNAYLTLNIAQTLLRSGDNRYRSLIRAVADLASPTGQWPEAINPITKGGCMGDGQHGWAAAEWIMMMRHLFIREEGNTLVIGEGIFPEWIKQETRLSFGPTLVPGGRLKVSLSGPPDQPALSLESKFHGPPLPCRIAVPGYKPLQSNTSVPNHILEPISNGKNAN